MNVKHKNVKIEIEELFIIAFLCCIFSIRIREFFNNYFICFLFIIFHEMSHILVSNIFGFVPNKIRLSLAGINAEYNFKYRSKKWIAIYLAGPVSNCLLAMIFKNIKIVFEVNLALGLINLLPINPLDGYNVLDIIIGPRKTKYVEKLIKLSLIIISIYVLIEYKNFSLIILLIYIIFANSGYTNAKVGIDKH